MKHRLLIILLAALCGIASASGQSIRSLGYNTTNGQVVYSGTNVLTYTNEAFAFSFGPGLLISNGTVSGNGRSIGFEDGSIEGTFTFENAVEFGSAAATRTNLSLRWNGLTNTNASGFRSALELSAGWLTNTNVTNFRTAIGLGATNDVEFNELRLGGSGQMGIVGSVGNIGFYDSIDAEYVLLIPADTDPVEINSQWNDSNVRSNLGLPLAALTNTSNVTMMRALSGSTNTNHPYSGSISVVGTNNTNVMVFSNGVLQSVQ